MTNKTRYTDTQVINFIEKQHTLHTKIDMLYVVDGYETTLLRDEREISKTYKGDTLRDALCQMMEAIDPPELAPKLPQETRGICGWLTNKRLIKITCFVVAAILAIYYAPDMKRAIKNNYVEAVLEHPEKKFPLSTELTNGFQAIQKKAKDAGIKYASIPGFNVSFFDCEDESEMFHRAQRSSFGIGVVMRCKDILPIKKLVVLQGDDGSIKLYTDQAYQDLPDRFAGMLSEKIYIRIFSAYTNKLNRMYTGRVTDDESKVRALATHSVAGDLE